MRSTAVVDVMLKIESTLFGGEGDYFVCWVLVLKGDFRRGGRFGVQGRMVLREASWTLASRG